MMNTLELTFKGGFSFRDNIVGKVPPHLVKDMMLGDGWMWAPEASPEHLLDCVTNKGWAVSPGRWKGGHKSKKKGEFIEASYLLLDFDENMTWDEAKVNDFFNQQALFAYTSVSHQQPGKGDRFRVCFAMDLTITDHKLFDLIITGVKIIQPGSDPAINAASLLYGNPDAEVHVFDLGNRLNTKDALFQAAIAEAIRRREIEAKRPNKNGSYSTCSDDNSLSRVQYWLDHIPNTSRDTWVRIAGCLRNIEGHGYDWAYDVFEDWSARDYADFDADACQRLWDSLDSNPGGFRKLKEYFIFFKENPDEESFTHQALPSTTRKIQQRINTLNLADGGSTDGHFYQL